MTLSEFVISSNFNKESLNLSTLQDMIIFIIFLPLLLFVCSFQKSLCQCRYKLTFWIAQSTSCDCNPFRDSDNWHNWAVIWFYQRELLWKLSVIERHCSIVKGRRITQKSVCQNAWLLAIANMPRARGLIMPFIWVMWIDRWRPDFKQNALSSHLQPAFPNPESFIW